MPGADRSPGISVLYFHSAVAKFAVTEWQDGTALYYWMREPQFGPAAWLRPVIEWVTLQPPLLAALTYGTLVLEFALAIALFLGPRARRVLLPAGTALHLGIAVCIGLWSFQVVMLGMLLLLLRRRDEPFAVTRWWRARRPRATAPAAESSRTPVAVP